MSEKTCETCGGTGKIYCRNSWFPADGYRRERCGICRGTGKSDFRENDRAYVRWQKERRAEHQPKDTPHDQ